jgi:hypothetical protein
MRFSSWYPAPQIGERAPACAGVFQVRGPDLLEYARGRSAMVHYEQAIDLRAAMIQWAANEGRDGWLYRHADDLGGRSPAQVLHTLVDRFVSRFGQEPSSCP